jgi:hypothetical protein
MDTEITAPQDLFSRTARALVDESAIEMTTESGDLIEIWTIAADGDAVRASAPRLQVRTGMSLACRILIDGTPHHLTAKVESAEVSSSSRAALVLRVAESSPEGVQRRAERTELHLPAVVTALVCDRIVPDEPLSAVIVDVSEGGLALRVADNRPRPNDLLRLQVRTFEGMIDCELRVRSVRGSDQPGNPILGCSFTACSERTAAIISRWITRVTESAAPATGASVRTALGIRPEQAAETPQTAPAPALRPAWQL